jgi:hypothetical protein
VAVETVPALRIGTPTRLFEARLPKPDGGVFHYAPSRDGTRFLINTLAEPERSAPVAIIVNWLRGATVPRYPRASS